MIEIITYKSIQGIDFGSNPQAIMLQFGSPKLERLNRLGEKEIHFESLVFRYSKDQDTLKEVTVIPECEIIVDGELVSWNKQFIKTLESAGPIYEVYGYLVSKIKGIALTGFHDGDEAGKAIHFFAQGEWDDMQDDMNHFTLD